MRLMQESGLRARKKERTRQEIIAAATRLFVERGFEATTVADIAAAADIAPRTFFGYFPSKEDVVFHDFEEIFRAFGERMTDRRPGETAFDVVRAWISDFLEGDDVEDRRCRRELIENTPVLEAHDHANSARFQEVLAAGVAEDLGVAPDALGPKLVAAAAIAALEEVGRHYEIKPVGPEALAVLDEALSFLEGGLAALRDRA